MSLTWCLQLVYFTFALHNYYSRANQIYQVYSYSTWIMKSIKNIYTLFRTRRKIPRELEPMEPLLLEVEEIELTELKGDTDIQTWEVLEKKPAML